MPVQEIHQTPMPSAPPGCGACTTTSAHTRMVSCRERKGSGAVARGDADRRRLLDIPFPPDRWHPITTTESIWMISSLTYAAAAMAFLAYLRPHPTGGVHAQYAFLALDPMFIGWALMPRRSCSRGFWC